MERVFEKQAGASLTEFLFQIHALFAREAEVCNEHERSVIQHEEQEQEFRDEKERQFGKPAQCHRRDFEHQPRRRGQETGEKQPALVPRADLVGIIEGVKKPVTRDEQTGKPGEEGGEKVAHERDHRGIGGDGDRRIGDARQDERFCKDQPRGEQRPQFVDRRAEQREHERRDEIRVEPAGKPLEGARTDAHMLFDKPEQERQADCQRGKADERVRPAARVHGGEKREQTGKGDASVRGDEFLRKDARVVGIHGHRKKVRRYQGEQENEYEIFEHIAQRAADVLHSPPRIRAKPPGFHEILPIFLQFLIYYIIKTGGCKAFVFILCHFFAPHARGKGKTKAAGTCGFLLFICLIFFCCARGRASDSCLRSYARPRSTA